MTDPEATREAIVADIQRVADELDTAPTVDEYNAYGEWSHRTAGKRFGSWAEAVRAAGYEPAGEIATDALLDDLRRVTDELETIPSRTDYREHGAYSASAIRRRFGGWIGAMRAAGLPDPPCAGEAVRESLYKAYRAERARTDGGEAE